MKRLTKKRAEMLFSLGFYLQILASTYGDDWEFVVDNNFDWKCFEDTTQWMIEQGAKKKERS